MATRPTAAAEPTLVVDGSEYAVGHVVVAGSRIVAVGSGPAPQTPETAGARHVDGRGCLLTPGLVNTHHHHHLYQWRLDTLGPRRCRRPVAALVLGVTPPLELLTVAGRPVVESDRLVTVDEAAVTGEALAAHRRLLDARG